ncbi:3,4-dihydroxy-2-butanone 4-phosphate synthase [Pseudonocardia sp. EC080610-09]|uniref:3,4-dihydroxy-2-butanone-4-phosphate synthase n=1 Tax=unclassified Pseudonocardia TaxID=2619320 RepID=UPI000705C08A|nr:MULTISPECIES: 3,4-dihydroxy-2-butanone-4-phosphate synthase [unclassified Pseudonocardia]ALL76690.1 3,4-dihydroxy-2-butanone 4-phosphate synthase [Pseudonocardia sp. EC080610-09]ALL83718.1 3,4-dihydroxy-2-butanone 4-phosphate synthase [Pseudonocardia sp. EC080619-01]
MTAVLEPAGAPAAARCDGVAGALAALRAGRPVLVVDDAGREGEGDVVLPAALAEPSWVAWTVRHTSGFLRVPMEAARADELDLPPMVRHDTGHHGTAYTVSVDAATGVGTGISARDRARTARVLADPASVARDLTRPGHVLPLRARPGGVLERAGHTEAAVDLCRLAGLPPVGLIAELVTGPGDPGAGRTADRAEIDALAGRHDVPVLDVARLVRHRHRHGVRLRRSSRTTLPTDHGPFDVVGLLDEPTGAEHLALLSPHAATDRPTLAVHVECAAGEVFGGRTCRCRRELDDSLAAVARTGGAVVHLRAPAGGRASGGCGGGDFAGAAGIAAAVAAELRLTAVRLRPGPLHPDDLRAGGIDAVPAAPPHDAPRRPR